VEFHLLPIVIRPFRIGSGCSPNNEADVDVNFPGYDR